jgi:large subunit ribosomal protein L40e
MNNLPITDPVKKRIAQEHRLYAKICRKCGAKNASSAKKCRKCRGHNLRWKKRETGTK